MSSRRKNLKPDERREIIVWWEQYRWVRAEIKDSEQILRSLQNKLDAIGRRKLIARRLGVSVSTIDLVVQRYKMGLE